MTLIANTSAIICEDGRFAVVDSHSRSSCGLVHGDGTSVVLHFSCLDDLHHYICCLADSLGSREKVFELCGISVSCGASPAPSGGSVESCMSDMNTAAAPESSDVIENGVNDVCAECDAGQAVSPAPSAVSVESCIIEMSTAPAPAFSDVIDVEASPAVSGISALTFSSEYSSGSTAESTVTDGRKRKMSSRTRAVKKTKSFCSAAVNSDVEFVGTVRNEGLAFRPLGIDVCQALCSVLNVDFVKVGGLLSGEVGHVGVPCRNEKIVPDGNCFFRAISQAVSGSQKHHRKIRLAVCKELERNADKYQSLLRSEYSSVLQYIQQSRMRSEHLGHRGGNPGHRGLVRC